MIEKYSEAAKRYLESTEGSRRHYVDWVSPVLATFLAASSTPNTRSKVDFSPSAEEYAINNNLKAILEGNYSIPLNTGLQGVTYTKLTRLSTHAEVDWCNQIINDLIYNQFLSYSQRAVTMMGKVVGELHDNVPSHADGAGFSCAQVYKTGEQRLVIFSIADSGCGMWSNVQKVTRVQDEAGAIQWCLQKGNTTARPHDPWAQRLPEDSIVSPFPPTTPTFSQENHHVGHGLWQLSELVKKFDGKLWILSGSSGKCAEYWYNSGYEFCQNINLPWQGVAISFQLAVPKGKFAPTVSEASLEDLGRRLGL